MQAIRDLEQKEALEDLFFGQVAIIWARWFLILTGGLLILWNAGDLTYLTLGVIPVAALMGMNFYLHGRYLMEKPISSKLVLLTSLLDVGIISLLVFFSPSDGGPLFNEFFIFYYPMVLAFALVMPRKIEVAYTVLVCVVYGVVSLQSLLTHTMTEVPFAVEFQSETKLLLLRIITIAAMGILGNYYFRIVRRRRNRKMAA